MKKLIALLLAAVMCLSLVACDGGKTPNRTDNNYTQQNEQLSSESTENNENNSTDREDESTQSNPSLAFLPYMCGEWKTLYIKDEGVLKSVKILENGDIEINGSRYKSVFCTKYENGATFEIIDGAETIGCFDIIVLSNGDIVLTLSMDTISASEIVLYKPAHYEIISVNTENVFEYFEWRDEWEEKRNAFGELEYVVIKSYLVLKEPYYSRISQQLMVDLHDENVIENGAIELQYMYCHVDVVVNPEEKTYTFENFRAGTEDTSLQVSAFGHSYDYVGIFARRLQIFLNDEGGYPYFKCPYDMKITRLKLDLYLIAE